MCRVLLSWTAGAPGGWLSEGTWEKEVVMGLAACFQKAQQLQSRAAPEAAAAVAAEPGPLMASCTSITHAVLCNFELQLRVPFCEACRMGWHAAQASSAAGLRVPQYSKM